MIVFDLTECQADGAVLVHGGGEYGKSALLHIVEARPDVELLVVCRKRLFLEDSIKELEQKSSIRFLWLNSIESYREQLHDLDVERNTIILPVPYRFYFENILFCRAKVILFVHGLRTIELTEDQYDWFYKQNYSFAYAKNILKRIGGHQRRRFRAISHYRKIFENIKPIDEVWTVSRHSRNAIQLYFGNFVEIENIEIAFPLAPFLGEPLVDKESGERNLILMVSVNRPEKNAYRVLRAVERYDLLSRIPRHYRLVLTGADHYIQNKILRRFSTVGDRLEVCGYVSRDELMELYKRAAIFLYPSLNEGFGIPPVEAFRYQVPVVASAATSISEILGEAADFFCPKDEGEMANRILGLLQDEVRRKQLVALGSERYQQLKKIAFAQWIKFARGLAPTNH